MCSQKNAGILLAVMALASSLPVYADDSAQMPPLPPRESSPSVPSTAPSAGSPTSTTAAGTAKPGTPAGAGATPAPPAPSDPNALLYAQNVAPGPFEAKRKLLLASIKAAKKQGFGITVYLGEFSKIEDQIKEGKGGPQLEDRIDSIADGLQDQLKRSQILKTQRPIGAPAHSQASASGGTSAGGLGGLGSGKSAEILQQLRAKYGDKVPANIDPAMLNSDAAKELMKRFKGGN